MLFRSGSFIFIDRLNNVTVGAGMVEESVEWTAHTSPVTAEERAARLGQKPAVLAVSAEVFAQAQQLERALLETGVVAIAKSGFTAEQISLLRETGVVVIVDDAEQADSSVTQTDFDAAVQFIQELVQL